MHLLLLALVGFGAATIASVTGGSSLLIVPVLIQAGLSPVDAVATSMLVLTSLSIGAAVRFQGAHAIPRHPTLGLTALSVPGSLVGAFAAIRLGDDVLRFVIGLATLAMAIVIVLQPHFGAAPRPRSQRLRLAGYVALGLWSIYGGMFSGGYATVLTLGCTGLFGLTLLESVALTRVVNLAGSLAATILFAVQGKIDWTVGAVMSVAALGGGWLGAQLALRWGPQTLRRLLFVTALLLSGKLLYDTSRSRRAAAAALTLR